MKKIFYALLLIALVGCSSDVTDAYPGMHTRMRVDMAGYAQRGFVIKPRGVNRAYMKTLGSLLCEDERNCSAPVDSLTGRFELSGVNLRDSLAQIRSTAREYFENTRLRDDMPLEVIVNVKQRISVNLNYLTSIAAPLIQHYIDQGMLFEDARLKAHTSLLASLHMPLNLVDFEDYNLYGSGEGDAMLAAVSLVIEKNYLDWSMTTDWRPLDLDTATGNFANKNVFSRLSYYARDMIFKDGAASARQLIKSKSPDGTVGNFEKYLNLLYSASGDSRDRSCTAANQGEMIETVYESVYTVLVCLDSAWRAPAKELFDVATIFNPAVEYGTLVDSRDGRSYKTVQVGNDTWMAENLKYSDSVATKNLKGQSWCYDNDESNCEVFGRMYNWFAAIDLTSAEIETVKNDLSSKNNRGICPEGWHLPKENEMRSWPEDGSFFSSFMSLYKNESGLSLLAGGFADAECEYDESGECAASISMNFMGMGRTIDLWGDKLNIGLYPVIYEFKYASTEYSYNKWQGTSTDKFDAAYVRCVKDR